MTPREILNERLLSHRLRGFDGQESTRLGLERALLAGVRNVEFDVGVSRDGCPVAYHDPFFRADDGTWRYVDDWDLAALRKQRALRQLATLEEMCACFARLRVPHALLHVDLKAAGHEAAVHHTIKEFGLLPHTVLVSWLPDVLVRFHALSPQTRLCFSHLSMARAPWLYPVAKALSPVVLHAAPAVIWGLRGIAPRLSNEILSVRLHFDDDGDPAAEPSGADETLPTERPTLRAYAASMWLIPMLRVEMYRTPARLSARSVSGAIGVLWLTLTQRCPAARPALSAQGAACVMVTAAPKLGASSRKRAASSGSHP